MKRCIVTIACWGLLAACGGSTPPGPVTDKFSAQLSAGSVVGATIASPGTGTAEFEWDGSRLTFVLSVQNMTQIIAAHIHAPATTAENAGIVVNLFIPANATGTVNGELAAGSVVATSHLLESVTLADVIEHVLGGRAYVLVHTTANPDGEIRGQIARQ